MANIVINKDLSKDIVGLQKYTPEQMKLIQTNWQAFEKSQKAMGNMYGVPTEVNRFSEPSLMGNALPVQKDAWGMWAETGIEVQREVLAVFSDLASTNSRGVDIGLIVDHFQVISDSSDDVYFSMDGRGKAKTDQPVVDYHGTPIGIYENNCSFGWRQMETMNRTPNNITPAAQRNKQFHLAKQLEQMALFGEPKAKTGDAEQYGLLTHPNRNSRSTGVTINGATPSEIKAEVIATLKLLHNDNFKSGVTLYFNWDDWFYMQSYQYAMSTAQGTPTATGATRLTIEQELMNIPGVERIVAADSIPANTIIALVKSRDVVEVLSAMPMSTRPKFRANPEDDYVFHNMAAQAVQLKFDYEGQMGLAVSQ